MPISKKTLAGGIIIFFIATTAVWFVIFPKTSIAPTTTPIPQTSPPLLPSPTSSTLSPATSSLKISTHRLFTNPTSPFNTLIPSAATYTKENQIGTIRPALEAYSLPIYRVTTNIPTIKVFNDYGRSEFWPIPGTAQFTNGSDHRLAVIDKIKHIAYEIWDGNWQSGSIHAGGMKDFPLQGDGLSHPKNQRVTAAGFAGSAGMITQEDFTDNAGKLNPQPEISHALMISIPHQILRRNAYIPPAQSGEDTSDNTGNIPLGAHYALPKNLNVEKLNVHPFVKSMAKAMRDYGAYVTDRNNSGQYNGKYVTTIQVEPGLIQKIYGTSNDALGQKIQQQMFDIIQQYGIYKVSE